MIAAGAKTILLTPNDAKAIIPAIKKAQDKAVMVIALDSPTDPDTAVDALFATDNHKAGVLIGQYAKVAMAGKPVKIATQQHRCQVAHQGARAGPASQARRR